jgi:hypothetical protein
LLLSAALVCQVLLELQDPLEESIIGRVRSGSLSDVAVIVDVDYLWFRWWDERWVKDIEDSIRDRGTKRVVFFIETDC